VIALLAPGQGAQTPGMFTPWLELAGVEQQLAEYGKLVDLDLIRLGTTADADEIKDTAVTQPLIVALGVVVADHLGLRANAGGSVVVAGHSIGELTAAGRMRPSGQAEVDAAKADGRWAAAGEAYRSR